MTFVSLKINFLKDISVKPLRYRKIQNYSNRKLSYDLIFFSFNFIIGFIISCTCVHLRVVSVHAIVMTIYSNQKNIFCMGHIFNAKPT